VENKKTINIYIYVYVYMVFCCIYIVVRYVFILFLKFFFVLESFPLTWILIVFIVHQYKFLFDELCK